MQSCMHICGISMSFISEPDAQSHADPDARVYLWK